LIVVLFYFFKSIMKTLFIAIGAVFLPLSFTSVAVANTPTVPVEPSNAHVLGTQEVGLDAGEDLSEERFQSLSTEINQEVGGSRGEQTQLLDQFIDLPPGLVVRGAQMGGVVVGGEF
jgi:hypothetical protein